MGGLGSLTGGAGGISAGGGHSAAGPAGSGNVNVGFNVPAYPGANQPLLLIGGALVAVWFITRRKQ